MRKSIAEKFNFSVVEDLSEFRFIKERIGKIPYSFAKEKKVLALDEEQDVVIVAVSNPLDFDTISELRLLLNKQIQVIYSPLVFLEKALEKCYQKSQEVGTSSKILEEVKVEQISKELEEYDLLEQVSQNPVIHFLNTLFIQALQMNASDIHLEPSDDHMKIRLRVDGVLINVEKTLKEHQAQLVARLKVMAKLDIAEQRLPQDGRIKLKMGEREIDFRMSTVPTVFGERIVLRILDRQNVILGLDKIGMDPQIFESFYRLIQSPEGIILVTGPTGSGKTTTLYSSISELNDSNKNIMTIEDPVEYKLSNIAQINVNPKINLNFSTGLRHILRQDPDVILIGEIRDRETAEIAIQASLTGHLVFSTLHTNDAASAIIRLAEMGIERYLLSSSIIGILAQRLVRKICSRCRESYIPTAEERKELRVSEDNLKFYKGKGCESCFHTGYKGRHAIYELIVVDEQLKTHILKNTINAQSVKKVSGRKDLYESGISLVTKGITTSSEILRACRIT